jgi:hypothetical protein
VTSPLAAVPDPHPTSATVTEVEYWKLRAVQAEAGRLEAAARLAATDHKAAVEVARAAVAEVLTAYGLDPAHPYRLTDAHRLELVPFEGPA